MRALICGIGGQDGAYLARFLLNKGYEVVGTSRDAERTRFAGLQELGVLEKVSIISMDIRSIDGVKNAVAKVLPDEIFNLSGQSSVALSFTSPMEALESISVGTLNLLEAIRTNKKRIKLFSAGSSECFGNTELEGADERTPLRPRSPYAIAKATAFWQVADYRSAYGIHACSGIFFNHESPLRPANFVVRKIIAGARNVASGKEKTLKLGNLDIERDWGWAPEYVEFAWHIMQAPSADDFVVATGESWPLREVIRLAFESYDLDWREHVVSDPSLIRPLDLWYSRGRPEKLERQLGCLAEVRLPQIVRLMVEAEDCREPL